MDLAWRKVILLMSDVALLYVSLALAVWLGFGQTGEALYLAHALPFTFLYAIWLVILYVLDLYDLSVPVTSLPFLRRWAIALALLFATGTVYFYALPSVGITPKTNLVVHVLAFGVFSYLTRRLLARRVAAWRIGLLGLSPRDRDELARVIGAYRHQGYACVNLEDNAADVARLVRDHRLHALVLPRAFFLDTSRLKQMYEALGEGTAFLDVPAAYEMFARRIPVEAIDERWLVSHAHGLSQSPWLLVKRGADMLGAGVLLALTSPLWPMIAFAVKLEDGGPVFYRQTRVGWRGKPFTIFKFRTMRTDAERAGAQWANLGDARATRVGAVLRHTHLDELPQMLNVLRGDVSLVGPRPERPEFVVRLEREIPHYRARHLVKPGFTGWAQIKFRYARSMTDSQRKFEYDLYYIKNRSLILDALILVKTIQVLFRGER